MNQPRPTDDTSDTKDDNHVVSKKQKTVPNSTTTGHELQRSSLSLFNDDRGPLRQIIELLDPGLDWPKCRMVSTSWHKCVLSAEKKWDGPDNKPSIWTGPVILTNPTSETLFIEKLENDFKLVRRTTEEERTNQQKREEKFGRVRVSGLLEDFSVRNWYRSDDDFYVHDPKPAIVAAQVNFLCRNVHHLFYNYKQDTELCSPNFSFAGARWCAVLHFESFYNGTEDVDGLGLTLKRVKQPLIKISDESELGSAPLVPNSMSCVVRYKAWFGIFPQGWRDLICKDRTNLNSLSGWLDDDDFDVEKPEDHNENIDTRYLELALGPTPPNVCSRKLRINLDLEFLGYGYDS